MSEVEEPVAQEGDLERCRLVSLPSGGVVRIRSEVEPTGESLAAVDDLMQAAARHTERMAALNPPDDGAAALWSRIAAVCNRELLLLSQAAPQMGIKRSVAFRIWNGRMPSADDLARIEAWLREHEGT